MGETMKWINWHAPLVLLDRICRHVCKHCDWRLWFGSSPWQWWTVDGAPGLRGPLAVRIANTTVDADAPALRHLTAANTASDVTSCRPIVREECAEVGLIFVFLCFLFIQSVASSWFPAPFCVERYAVEQLETPLSESHNQLDSRPTDFYFLHENSKLTILAVASDVPPPSDTWFSARWWRPRSPRNAHNGRQVGTKKKFRSKKVAHGF